MTLVNFEYNVIELVKLITQSDCEITYKNSQNSMLISIIFCNAWFLTHNVSILCYEEHRDESSDHIYRNLSSRLVFRDWQSL